VYYYILNKLMMNPNYTIAIAFLLGVGLRILTNPWILGYLNENYSVHKNKIYDSLLFGSMAGIIQVMIDNGLLTNTERFIWIILFVCIFIILNHIISEQIFIKEKDLLLTLRENYAESIKYSDVQLLNKGIDEELKTFLIMENNNKKEAIKQINKILMNKYKI
jgi:hypothetical protein